MKPTVLVVDDTPDNLALIGELLKPHHRVKLARDGETALELMRGAALPDLVLLDVMMPGLDGYAVCRLLKADPHTSHVPVIFLTARTEVDDERRGLEAGGADYITKPISPPIVMARIATQLALKAAADFLRDQNAFLEQEVERRTREVIAANEARQQLQLQLQQAQKMEVLGRLAGGVAHDFNNLLTVINGTCELMLRLMDESDPNRDDVTEIRNAGERAARLTRQLLTFSRKQIVQRAVLSVSTQLTGETGMLRRLVGEDVTLTIAPAAHGEADATDLVLIDPGQLGQVVLNLAVNARDAMPQGGRLSIGVSVADVGAGTALSHPGVRAGRFVVLTVADTGTGMTDEVRRHIFEPFFTTKGPEKGTGLGLATVFGIVSQAGGFIDVESAPGEGATFRVHLPVATKAPVAVTQAAPAGISTGTETVLLVEDERATRNLVARMLQVAGYTVLPAADADEAMALMQQHAGGIDLLLTDVVLPGTNGGALAAQVQAASPRTAVLFMSGYLDDRLEGAVSPDASNLIAKPFTDAALVNRVRERLGCRPGAES